MIIKRLHNGTVWSLNIGGFLSWLVVTIIVLSIIGIKYWWIALLYGIKINTTEND